MMAVCDGNRGCGSKDHMTCDARRGSEKLTINPLKESTLQTIQYTNSGVIYSTSDKINTDLNETLNLNDRCRELPKKRKAVLYAMIAEIDKRDKSKDKEWLSNYLSNLRSAKGKKEPYVGIQIWWLEKRLAKL